MIETEMEPSGTDVPFRHPGSSASRGGVESSVSAIHDLGNLIQVASSGISILARDPDVIAAPSLSDVVNGARAALDRAGSLVRNAIAKGSEQRCKADLVSVATCLAEIKRLVEIAWGGAVRLEVRVGPNLPMVACDYLALQSALLNLLFNAHDAMPDGGLVSVRRRWLWGRSMRCSSASRTQG